MGRIIMLKVKLGRTNHLHINEMINKFEQEEESAFRKVHRMIDLFEVIIKTHTTAILASCFDLNYISDDMKSLLAWGLRTPSLGLWCLFSREAIVNLIIRKALNYDEYQWAVKRLHQKGQTSIIERVYDKKGELYHINYDEVSKIKECKKKLIGAYKRLDNFKMSTPIIGENFYNYFLQWDSYVKSGENYPKKDVISFRNSYAHGGTPSEEDCMMDIKAYLPLLKRMLGEKWLHTTKIEIGKESIGEIHRTYLVCEDNKRLDLFPLLQYVVSEDDSTQEGYYFLNDLKNFHEGKEEVCLLNYPDAQLLKEDRYPEAFLEVINIHEWKKYKPTNEFQQRINELSESFKGRVVEKEIICEFIENNNEGFFMLTGNPGIGKSAIFAKVIEEFKRKLSSNTMNVHIIEYFIRRNTQGNPITKFLEYFHRKLDEIYDTRISYIGDLDKDRMSFYEKLRIISEFTNKKIVIFIDGIDEGVGKGTENILNYLITENYPNVLVLYSSRWRSDTERFYLKLPIEYKSMLKLEGLKKEDIRGMLYEVTNKYELDKHSLYIEEILNRSEGNPLYVKLLCQDIERGNKSINRMEQLPDNLKAFYDEILLRFAEEPEGDILLNTLYLFAAAEEYVSPMFVELCMELTTSQQHQIFMTLREVLIENPNNPNTYQIFHESLREYLITTKTDEINKAHYDIVKFCSKWESYLINTYLSRDIRTYAAKYYSRHLLAIKMVKEMEELVLGEGHEAYLQYQIESSNQLDLSFQTYHDAFELFNLEGNNEPLIQTAVKAYQLHNKKNKLYKDIFLWMNNGDLTSLKKASQRIMLYIGQEKKNLYLLLLYNVLNSSVLEEKEKLQFIKNCLEESDDYLEIVESDNELPSFIVGSIIEYCISYDLDFSKIINVEYLYCKADCGQYKPFIAYILDIYEYFIQKNNIQASVELTKSIGDIAIASRCALKLLYSLYEEQQIWNQEVIDMLLRLASKYDNTYSYSYPFADVFNAMLETNQHQRVDELIKLYLYSEEIPAHLNSNLEFESICQVILALYKVKLYSLGDKIIEEYAHLFLEFYHLYHRDFYNLDEFILDLYRLNKFVKANRLLNLIGDESYKIFIIERAVEGFLRGDVEHVLKIADYYKDIDEIQSIIRKVIEENPIERNIPLFKIISEESVLFKPFESQIKDLQASAINQNQKKGTKSSIDKILESIDENSANKKSIEAIIERCKKRSVAVKYRICPELFKGLMERNLLKQALKLYMDEWHFIPSYIVLGYFKKDFDNKDRKRELVKALHEAVERNGQAEEYQVLIELLINLYIYTGDIDVAYSWYKKLGENIWPRIVLNTSIDLYEVNKKKLAGEILEDLFNKSDKKLILTKEDIEECNHRLEQKIELDEEETPEKVEKNINYEEEIIKKEDESPKDYIIRLAANKYYANTKDDFINYVSQIDNDYYIERILGELGHILRENDEIELLIKLNNLLTEDRYNKMQSIAALACEIIELKDINRIASWIETAELNIDTYYMKMEFYEWIIDELYEAKERIPQIVGVLLPYLFKHQELLGNALLKYTTYLICQDNELNNRDKLLESLKEIIVLDDISIDEKREWTLDNLKDWIHLIHDVDDQEEILQLADDYDLGKLSEDRMKKKLSRILREYQ